MLGAGGAAYLELGHPFLATRTLDGNKARDLNALIGRLATVVRSRPQDPRGWAVLGRAYLTAGDPGDAAKAFSRAISASQAFGPVQPFLYSAYGEALTQDPSGAVTPEAEAAFTQALAGNPKDMAARYYLGLAAAARGDGEQGADPMEEPVGRRAARFSRASGPDRPHRRRDRAQRRRRARYFARWLRVLRRG